MRITRLRVPIIVALLAALTTTVGITAQETDTPLDLSGAVYQGPCDSLNLNPTWQVGDFIEVDDANLIGYTDVGPLLRSEGLVDTTMDDLFREGGAYSFVVTDNTAPDADPVACGKLGGVLVNGQVVIGLYTDFLPDPDDTTDDADDDEGNLVGVAIFGRTSNEGDRTGQGAITTQQTPASNVDLPAQLPDQVPVQAYLFVDELDDEDEPEPTATAVPQQQQQAPPPPTNTPVPPTNTPVPPTATMMPPTETPTIMPTEMPTMMPPTEAPPTEAPPTEAPPTAAPPTMDDGGDDGTDGEEGGGD